MLLCTRNDGHPGWLLQKPCSPHSNGDSQGSRVFSAILMSKEAEAKKNQKTGANASLRLIEEYPESFPPLGIFGASAEEEFFGKTLRGYVFNHTRPMTADEVDLEVAALRQRRGVLGPVDGRWLERTELDSLVAAVALLAAGLLSRLLRRTGTKGAGRPGVRSGRCGGDLGFCSPKVSKPECLRVFGKEVLDF
eukprot:g11830.t1